MPLDLEPRPAPSGAHRTRQRAPAAGAIVIGLVNNMPDGALQATETQFGGLLQEASGAHAVRLRLTSLPGLPRSAEASAYIERAYWPLAQLLDGPLDALIVTGTEPRAPVLREEPYWQSFVQLLDFARARTAASVWSCLAAHAAVLSMDGIERQRLAAKRSGVYAHSILEGHPLLAGVSAPLPMPHSRWNELAPPALRAAGYQVLSWSEETGADAFVRAERSLLLFFQGHPEYEDVTLLKEYRRDVGRYLAGQQAHYPTLPHGYLSIEATRLLEAFRQEAGGRRDAALLESFPFAIIAAGLRNSWRTPAVAIYRNWLAFIRASRLSSQRAPAAPRAAENR
ncbi:MAG: homoserine O-succinyltransferase [Gammaproteobacteria bacterium]|nr:homoserine O-succinyltransferase [Gammaproteobacteria bacterium]